MLLNDSRYAKYSAAWEIFDLLCTENRKRVRKLSFEKYDKLNFCWVFTKKKKN